MPGALYIVATPIGNAGDLPPRAVHMLRSVSIIAAEDPACTQALLAPYGIGTPVTSYQNDNKEEKTPLLLRRLEEGQDVALVSDAGTPVIADPGRFLIDAAAARGVMISPIPGASAITATLSVSGFSGDAYGFLGQIPASPRPRKRLFQNRKHDPQTLVCFIAPHQLARTLTELCVLMNTRRAVVAANLTTARERILRGTVAELARMPDVKRLDGDITLVIEGAPASSPRRRPSRKTR